MHFSHLYDDTAFEDRVRAAGNAAWGAYCRMQAYCSHNLTDGYVAAPIARAIATRVQLAKLVNLGYLEPLAGGYTLIGYTEEQPTRLEIHQRRARWAYEKDSQRHGGAE